jgi:hypothetical protein
MVEVFAEEPTVHYPSVQARLLKHSTIIDTPREIYKDINKMLPCIHNSLEYNHVRPLLVIIIVLGAYLRL